jgi:hypothetical protein
MSHKEEVKAGREKNFVSFKKHLQMLFSAMEWNSKMLLNISTL